MVDEIVDEFVDGIVDVCEKKERPSAKASICYVLLLHLIVSSDVWKFNYGIGIQNALKFPEMGNSIFASCGLLEKVDGQGIFFSSYDTFFLNM